MKKTNTVHPSHKVWFADEETQNDHGVEVGVVWPRKGDKQGGILKWSLSPAMLGAGVWRLLSSFYLDQAAQKTNPKIYTISFAQKHHDTGKLGRPVKVASVSEDSRIHWSIAPEKLAASEGALFVLQDRSTEARATEVERPAGRFNAHHGAAK